MVLVICGLAFVWFGFALVGRVNGKAVEFWNYVKYKGHTKYLLI